MCWEGPFFPTHESWWGEAGGISKGHYSRSKSGGGRSQLFLHVLPRQSRRIRGEGKRHARRKEPSFPRIRKGQGRDAIQPPISQTIAKVKDLVSESMRWVVGMWWGKQRCWKQGCCRTSPWPCRTQEGRRGQQGQQSLVSFSKDVVLFALHVLKVKG